MTTEQKKISKSVRFDLQCISLNALSGDSETFAYGETFSEAIEDLIVEIEHSPELPSPDEWFQTYYYLNDDNGYFFYLEEDLRK